MTAAGTKDLTAPVLGELELVPWSVGDDPHARGRIAAPISAETGSSGIVVYLELDPGDRIPLHSHSADETIVVLEGSAIATAGDQQGPVSVGSVIVAPAFAKHGFENTGEETLRLVGVFPTGTMLSYFEGPVAPFGTDTFLVPVM